jgi:hypothetical protein
MSFGDYQQNYDRLHERLLQSRRFSQFNKPVVNAEYGYFLRDQNGDGLPDKDNSTSLDIIRHASWDIVMAGGYFLTGFGTTYFGGHRDPGPFALEAEKNEAWETQIGLMKKLFTAVEWWKLEPHDGLVRSQVSPGTDRRHLGRAAPSETAYWCLAEPGRQFLAYVRGITEPVLIHVGDLSGPSQARQWNPRTGDFTALEFRPHAGQFAYRPPDGQDWVVIVESH